jgi:hypothetical protein
MKRVLQSVVVATLALGAGQGLAGEYAVPVKITNTPVPVTVTNPVATVQEPFQHQFSLDWPDGQGLVTGTYYVPAGRRLVIEYASLSAYLPPTGQAMFVRVVTTVNGSGAFHTLAVQRQEDYGVLKQFGAAHLVRIFADPGSMVQVSVGRVPSTSTANCNVTLSGFFQAVP